MASALYWSYEWYMQKLYKTITFSEVLSNSTALTPSLILRLLDIPNHSAFHLIGTDYHFRGVILFRRSLKCFPGGISLVVILTVITAKDNLEILRRIKAICCHKLYQSHGRSGHTQVGKATPILWDTNTVEPLLVDSGHCQWPGKVHTVEPLIKDPPRKRQPVGHSSKYHSHSHN